MARRRSSGDGLWLVIVALVLIVMIPKEVWIAVGVLAGIAGAAYLAIKLFSGNPEQNSPDAYRHEPTLAELTGGGERRPGKGAKDTMVAPPSSEAADQPLARQSSPSLEARDAVSERNRERTESLGSKHSAVPVRLRPIAASTIRQDDLPPGQPPGWTQGRSALADENRRRSEAMRERLPSVARSLPPEPMLAATVESTSEEPLIQVPSAYRTREIRGQTEEWHRKREEELDANRRRTDYLRKKFPQGSDSTRPRGQPASTPPVAPALSPITQTTRLVAETPCNGEHLLPPAPTAPLPPAVSSERLPTKPERSLGDFMRMLQGSNEPDNFYSAPAAQPSKPTHALPTAPQAHTETKWFGPDETAEVAGLTLPGGLLYVGPRLYAAHGDDEPALIKPQLRVAAYGDYRISHTNYWPSYSELSPEARRAYLTWLAEGRSHPDCDVGLVFLFFYGLERRVIWDSPKDDTAKADWPAIGEELRRLLAVYGDKSNSFRRYAGELLSWMALSAALSKLYELPVPELPRTYELAPYMRLALGQAAVDRKPLPAALALSWVRLSPEISLRTAATRCPREFERLFIQRYHDVLGTGLVLPKNRTKLKLVYQPASRGLSGRKIMLDVGQVPDVTALTVPIRTLREIAEQCTEELGAYSRVVGKDPALAGSLEGLLLLPASLWPTAMQARLRELLGQMRDGRLSLPLQDLLNALGGTRQPINRDRARALARALEAEHVGMEPHVLGGARAPGESDTVVLFTQPLTDAAAGSGAEFQSAALTLQLAAAMAVADGDFNAGEVAHLRQEIDGWAHLSHAERSRLHAHLQWLITSPPTLAGLKKKLEPLPLPARETVAAFMVTLAHSDGFVSPEEVKFLEKIYKALGVEPKRVFSDVHAASAGRATSPSIHRVEKEGFYLDPDRIAALQEDTARVSALLSKIFTEEALPAPPEPDPITQSESPLALDEGHTALLRLMLSRPTWSRAELEDAAADLELMLDGALEQINEAAFDAFDAPLCEGDDPVEVNSELLEKLDV